jgi:hypothetical protein
MHPGRDHDAEKSEELIAPENTPSLSYPIKVPILSNPPAIHLARSSPGLKSPARSLSSKNIMVLSVANRHRHRTYDNHDDVPGDNT